MLIRTPGELGSAIRVVQANLEDGTLEEVPREDPFLPDMEPFVTLRDKGPWADILSYGFRCRDCGALFQFSAEIYHGRGGRWAPANRPSQL
jgi:hypothetical protein